MSPIPAVPALRGLGPIYDKDLHGRHSAVLLKVLSDTSSNAAKNIALAGHYGSGKSSVILGVQAGLTKKKIPWVNLSLSSLGFDDTEQSRIQQDGTLAPRTNLIQKEIVKQLLYRKSPADMPGSRYFRIESFRAWPAVIWSGVVAISFFAIAVLLGLVNRVNDVAPKDLVGGRGWVPWAIVAIFGLFMGGTCFLSLRTLQSRVRVESISAGGAAVKLSAKENSYFDDYLDEIVYFFQKTKTQVAFFEDLDRFKDPHIFETLRELNTVLNNSEQIKSRPVRFVYAVRDSIFEQLNVGVVPDGGLGGRTNVAAPRASALESTPSANRTKFFDLLVPMVPFITHRSARDLLAAEFTESDNHPSTPLVNLVGAHLTDMRIIRNIRNEFEIYRASILGEMGLKGLTADRLFAMMVYKNLHLEDFEAIRLGTSKIDEAHKAFRDMVQYQTAHQTARSKAALDQAASNSQWEMYAKAAGDHLRQALLIVHRATRRGGEPTIQHGSNNYPLSSLTSEDFWISLFDSREGVLIVHPGYAQTNLSFAELLALAGDKASAMNETVDADISRLQRVSRMALETKEFVTKATMSELMARSELVMPVDGLTERNLTTIVTDLVTPLTHDLLAKGYIDENFTLYCSDYHAVAISVSAMNFILHCVQANREDHYFRFDEASSIDSVRQEMGDRFLDGESVFNIQVFDHYLPVRPELLDRAFAKLVMRAVSDSAFVDSYVADGAASELLVSQLAGQWTTIFVYLVEKSPTDLASKFKLMDAASRSAVRGMDYETTDQVAAFVSEHYVNLQVFVEAMNASRAADLAILLRRLGSQISDLAILGSNQRKAVVEGRLYPITRGNLSASLGEGMRLALDAVKATDEAVYGHILENLDTYLDVLDESETTIDSRDDFIGILGDLDGATTAAVLRVVEGASEACEVADLEVLDKSIWTSVISAGRFAPTAWNLCQFVAEFGVSEELLKNLNSLEITDVQQVEEESRLDLAHALANSEGLESEVMIRLVTQLDLPSGLDRERLTVAGLRLIPSLLAADLLPDDAKTYTLVSDHRFDFLEEYFSASKDLASYVCELPLSGDDLAILMRSHRVSSEVKRTVTEDLNFVNDRLTRNGATAICEWASEGNTISSGLLVALSQAGVTAELILPLVKNYLSGIELPTIDEILLALGDEYEPLTRVGHHSPRLKDRPGTEELLEELKNRGRVSSFGPGLAGGIRVYMRR